MRLLEARCPLIYRIVMAPDLIEDFDFYKDAFGRVEKMATD